MALRCVYAAAKREAREGAEALSAVQTKAKQTADALTHSLLQANKVCVCVCACVCVRLCVRACASFLNIHAVSQIKM